MNRPLTIVVPVKHVPDAAQERVLAGDPPRLQRGTGILCELDEYALEAALQLVEARGGTAAGHRVLALTMGPAPAADALKRALQLGADAAVHVLDDALAGSDAWATALVLAAAVRRTAEEEGRPVDLVLTGMASTDGETSLVPGQLAERLGLAHVGFATALSLDDDAAALTAVHATATESLRVEAPLPALVAVTDRSSTPRYPSFKAILAAKKKPVRTWSAADLGLGPEQVGTVGSRTEVLGAEARPPRTAGRVIHDDGEGGIRLAEFLLAERLV
ncbi:electron transfer flavoprotein subunit beta/FixA family protein [Kocuria flava]|uniref:Electron transfer flavoprotein subunit beta n=1 Tax=Kocuria flava TaxID=446860 RepID=A0ABQ0WZY7_9MICC|nr:electron transfer flavoprotein subunit beta/FixA family protein [Kocuria flava]GEO90887.1 electron transfer flavoprotein subunit beta [Kocuria flava]